jgi:hypothetical protein
VDILSKLPFLKDETSDVDDALSHEDAKAANIDFHRRSVRNGPAKFSTPTSGQTRRAGVRDLARRTKKARRAQVRGFLSTKSEVATLRGNLQAAGVVPYRTPGFVAGPLQAHSAIVWILRHFAEGDENGRVEVTRLAVIQSIGSAIERYNKLTGTNYILDPGYELPVAVSA